jgi:hypothetical protein
MANMIAKMVARRTGLPAYVGNSLSFSNTALGGAVEEQMDLFKKIAEVVVEHLKPRADSSTTAVTNGVRRLDI